MAGVEGRPEIPHIDGDVISPDGEVSRIGIQVTGRELVIDRFGKYVYLDQTLDDAGNTGERLITDYPEGAVMAILFKRLPGEELSQARIFMGEVQVYGTGRTDAIEGFGRRKGGREKNPEPLAREMLENRGFEPQSVIDLLSVDETSSRQNNITDLLAFELDSVPDEDVLRENKIFAKTLAEVEDMIRTGIISNAATISAVYRFYLTEREKDKQADREKWEGIGENIGLSFQE